MRFTPFLTCTAALVLAPLVQGADFSLKADFVVANGDIAATGRLAGWFLTGRVDEQELPGFQFSLTAEQLRVEHDTAAATLDVVGNLEVEPTTTGQDYAHATVTGTAIRPGYAFDVLPRNATLAFSGDCLTLAPTSIGEVERTPRVNLDRPPFKPPTDGGTLWVPCGDAPSIVVAGNFCISLWEWDAQLSSSRGEETLSSGRAPLAETGGLPDGRPGIGRDQQVFLCTQDGRLRVPVAPDFDAYVGNGSEVQTEGTLTLENAYGTLEPVGLDVDLDGESAELAGHFDLTTVAGDPELAFFLRGDAETALVGTRTLAPGQGGDAAGPWLWLAVLLGAGLGGAWVWRLHQRAPEGLFREAIELADQGRNRPALRRVQACLRRQSDHGLALALRGHILGRLARTDAAIRDHEGAHVLLAKSDPERAAANAIDAAGLLQHRNMEAAIRWMRRAYALDRVATCIALERDDYKPLRGEIWRIRLPDDAYA